jgi:hypothetical protein
LVVAIIALRRRRIAQTKRDDDERACDREVGCDCLCAHEEFAGTIELSRRVGGEVYLRQIDERARLVGGKFQRGFKLRGGLRGAPHAQEDRAVVVARRRQKGSVHGSGGEMFFRILQITRAIREHS